jgi:MFS family permease
MSEISIHSKKPKLSFWQVWNMSFGFLGIQFGFALQNANTSRIFETLGADSKNLAIYWLAAPVTGLIVQPIIGYLSDRTWHPYWGRRRPFFAIGAILATAALIIMPNSPVLWMAIGMLWIMDASINISMEPFRAFVGDMLPNEQRTKGFAMQSFFIGIGAVVASALPWFLSEVVNLPNTTSDAGIPFNVKLSYYLGAFAFLVAVMWTVFTTKEYPPSAEDLEEKKKKPSLKDLVIRYTPGQYMTRGIVMLLLGIGLTLWFYTAKLDPQLYVVAGILGLFGLSYLIGSLFMRKGHYHNGFVHIVRDFQNMPKTMVQLAFVQFFSWFALFAMWIYTTNGITSHIYDMKLNASDVNAMQNATNALDLDAIPILTKDGEPVTDPETARQKRESLTKDLKTIQDELNQHKSSLNAGEKEVVSSYKLASFFLDHSVRPQMSPDIVERTNIIKAEFNKGGDWVGILFGVYNGFAALAAIFLPWIARKTSRKITHLIMLIIGGIGLISFYFIGDPNWLIVPMIGVGFAWASILAIPYAMLSASLPAKKMGYYMGIFNFFIVIPQMVAAAVLGFLITRFFDGQFIYALVLGGISMILSGLLSLRVEDHEEVEMKEGHA